jgi:anti-sigma regulatory factor (Ser/Thr protein kinase)
MTHRATFRPEPGSVRAARTFVNDQLHHLDPDERDLVALLVSELATNAVVHAATAFSVTVHDEAGDVTVTVGDDEPRLPPAPTPFEEHGEGGRGLAMVAAMAATWGADPEAAGKRVWFTVRTGDGGPGVPDR